MHELGVVFHVIKSVNRIAEENNVKRVSAVTIELGEVSAVIPEYLQDCWKWAVSKETVLYNAELVIEPIKAVTFCRDCNRTYPTVEFGKTCPYCGSGETHLLQGNEFILKNIVAEDNIPGEDETEDENSEETYEETFEEENSEVKEVSEE